MPFCSIRQWKRDFSKKAIAFLLMMPLIVGQALIGQDKAPTCPENTESSDSKFRPGQKWQYKTRPHEEGCTLTILKLRKQRTIIHIRVEKIRLGNFAGGPEPDKFEHMPLTRDAVGPTDLQITKTDAGAQKPFQARLAGTQGQSCLVRILSRLRRASKRDLD